MSLGVDMTSGVKRANLFVLRRLAHCVQFLLRAAVEAEPVIATVDHADIRGLATTLLVSVRRLPRV